MVIVEYCRYGNLSAFLKSKRDVFVHDRVSSAASAQQPLTLTVQDGITMVVIHTEQDPPWRQDAAHVCGHRVEFHP